MLTCCYSVPINRHRDRSPTIHVTKPNLPSVKLCWPKLFIAGNQNKISVVLRKPNLDSRCHLGVF